jgi:hypothetical protein
MSTLVNSAHPSYKDRPTSLGLILGSGYILRLGRKADRPLCVMEFSVEIRGLVKWLTFYALTMLTWRPWKQ